MSHTDSSKYAPGFREAVKRLLGAHSNAWGTTYTAEAMLEQELSKAYHRGRMDGVTESLGLLEAPGGLVVAEEARPSTEAVWEALGLFVAGSEPPGTLTEALLTRPDLPPLDGDHVVWSVRHSRALLGLSLRDGTDYVRELLGD